MESPAMHYQETEEYKKDQEAYEAGDRMPAEVFRVAQRWGIESKLASLDAKANTSKEAYIAKRLDNHKMVWKRAGMPCALCSVLCGKVLDLGCGTVSAFESLPAITELVGIDPALWAYTRYAPNKSARLGRTGKYLYVSGVIQNIKDEDFDVVYSFNAIDHGVDWEDVIKHCARVLKDRGYLLLGVHVADKVRDGPHRRLTHPCNFSIEQLNSELWHNGLVKVWQEPVPNPRCSTFLSYTWAMKLKGAIDVK